MTPPRRPPVDLWLLELMLEAQGFKCFCCGRAITLETCQRGHIDKRNLDGSNDGPENVAPACVPCNKAHGKADMMPHDHLALDYFERLRILILVRIPGRISCKLMAPSRRVILTTQADENTYFIDLKNSEFDLRTEVYYRSRKLTPDEAKKVVGNFIAETMRSDESVPAPDDLAQRLMASRVMDYGDDAFLRVGNRVVRLQRWRDPNGRIDFNFWKREIVDNFYRHEKEARREERASEEDAKKVAASRLEWEQRNREARWVQYLLAADVAFPATHEDNEFVAAVRAEKEAGVARDVTEEELQRSRDVIRREVKWWRDKVLSELGKMFKEPGSDRNRIGELVPKVRAATDIPTMRRYQDLATEIAYSDREAASTATSALESSLAEGIDERSNDSEIPF
jgi:hypothetical protein